jgi:hypothetical protein
MRGRSRFFIVLMAGALTAVLAVPAVSAAPALDLTGPVWKAIRAPVPAWATWGLHERVMAAGPQGVPIPEEANIPVSSLGFLGIRPGQLLLIFGDDTISLCTSNFVFQSGSQYYIGTAGHCGSVGDEVDMVFLPNGIANIGRIVKSTGDKGIGNDFALIEIHQTLNQWVSPSMAFWGGPTAAYGDSGPALVEHVGWGLVVGTGGTPRVGLGVEWTPDEWRFEGVITFGDSGSGANVVHGLAAGNITHISVHLNTLTVAAGTSIQKILQLAGVPLATCPTAIPWPLPGCP